MTSKGATRSEKTREMHLLPKLQIHRGRLLRAPASKRIRHCDDPQTFPSTSSSLLSTMSSATLIKSITFRPSVNVQTRSNTQPKRLSRTRLGIHAVTKWQLEPKKPANKKGEFLDLTDSIADKATASVKSSGGDFTLKGLEDAGLDLVFRSEGAGQAADSPADLFIKDVGSKTEIKLDGKALEKNKEYKISVGQELNIGEDATWLIVRDTEAHA